MALGVVSSNPPPLVDTLPGSHESGIFLSGIPLGPVASVSRWSWGIRKRCSMSRDDPRLIDVLFGLIVRVARQCREFAWCQTMLSRSASRIR